MEKNASAYKTSHIFCLVRTSHLDILRLHLLLSPCYCSPYSITTQHRPSQQQYKTPTCLSYRSLAVLAILPLQFKMKRAQRVTRTIWQEVTRLSLPSIKVRLPWIHVTLDRYIFIWCSNSCSRRNIDRREWRHPRQIQQYGYGFHDHSIFANPKPKSRELTST